MRLLFDLKEQLAEFEGQTRFLGFNLELAARAFEEESLHCSAHVALYQADYQLTVNNQRLKQAGLSLPGPSQPIQQVLSHRSTPVLDRLGASLNGLRAQLLSQGQQKEADDLNYLLDLLETQAEDNALGLKGELMEGLCGQAVGTDTQVLIRLCLSDYFPKQWQSRLTELSEELLSLHRLLTNDGVAAVRNRVLAEQQAALPIPQPVVLKRAS